MNLQWFPVNVTTWRPAYNIPYNGKSPHARLGYLRYSPSSLEVPTPNFSPNSRLFPSHVLPPLLSEISVYLNETLLTSTYISDVLEVRGKCPLAQENCGNEVCYTSDNSITNTLPSANLLLPKSSPCVNHLSLRYGGMPPPFPQGAKWKGGMVTPGSVGKGRRALTPEAFVDVLDEWQPTLATLLAEEVAVAKLCRKGDSPGKFIAKKYEKSLQKIFSFVNDVMSIYKKRVSNVGRAIQIGKEALDFAQNENKCLQTPQNDDSSGFGLEEWLSNSGVVNREPLSYAAVKIPSSTSGGVSNSRKAELSENIDLRTPHFLFNFPAHLSDYYHFLEGKDARIALVHSPLQARSCSNSDSLNGNHQVALLLPTHTKERESTGAQGGSEQSEPLEGTSRNELSSPVCSKTLNEGFISGISISGLGYDETPALRTKYLDASLSLFSPSLPRFLPLSMGNVMEVFHSVLNGVDIVECYYPISLALEGKALIFDFSNICDDKQVLLGCQLVSKNGNGHEQQLYGIVDNSSVKCPFIKECADIEKDRLGTSIEKTVASDSFAQNSLKAMQHSCGSNGGLVKETKVLLEDISCNGSQCRSGNDGCAELFQAAAPVESNISNSRDAASSEPAFAAEGFSVHPKLAAESTVSWCSHDIQPFSQLSAKKQVKDIREIFMGNDAFEAYSPCVLDLKDIIFSADFNIISENSLVKETRAYIHHLITVHEMLGTTLLCMHNLQMYWELFREIRRACSCNTGSDKSPLEAFIMRFIERNMRFS